MGDRNGEAAILDNVSNIYHNEGNISKAIDFKQMALQVLVDSRLPCDAGGTTKDQIEKELLELKSKMEDEDE